MFLLVLTVPTLAQPPFQNVQEAGDLTIVYPTFFAYAYSTDITLNFDILDENFQKMDDGDVTCNIDGVDSTGTNIFSDPLSYDSVNEYWFYALPSPSPAIGIYNYYVHCYTADDRGGYASLGYEVTADGQQIHNDLTPVAMIILIPLFLAFLLIVSIFAVGEGHPALKLFMFLLSFISVSVSYNYAVKIISTFYASTSLVEFIASDYAWYGWVLFMLIIYFVIYWIIQITTNLSQRKIDKFRFEDGGRK